MLFVSHKIRMRRRQGYPLFLSSFPDNPVTHALKVINHLRVIRTILEMILRLHFLLLVTKNNRLATGGVLILLAV